MYTMNNHFGGEIMREEYDIMQLNPRKIRMQKQVRSR